jgi:vacuolar-type H+-ATPase subunit E/Vma4
MPDSPAMPELRRAVLDKIREEAAAIREAAEQEAARELEGARERHQARLEVERRCLLEEADMEAARILAQARMEARSRLAAVKAETMERIINAARKSLEEGTSDRAALARLIAEGVEALGGGCKARVGVRAEDLELAREAVAADEALVAAVSEVVAEQIDGGAVIESEDGAFLIDNSHAARLGMLVPRVVARFAGELF